MENPSVKYQGDGVRTCWPIPFCYGGVQDIGVSVISPAGAETRLAFGSGYTLAEHSVIAPVASGHQICIWLTSPMSQALQGQIERAKAAAHAGISEAASAWHAENSARIAMQASAEASATVAAAKLEVENARQDIAGLASKAIGDVQAGLNNARTAISDLVNNGQASITRHADSAKATMQTLASQGISDMQAQANTGRVLLEGIQSKAATEIAATANSATRTMTYQASQSMAGMDEKVKECETTFTAMQKACETTVTLTCNDAITRVRESASVAIADVNNCGSAARHEFQEFAQDAFDSIRDIGNEALKMITQPGFAALSELAEIDFYDQGFFVVNDRLIKPTMPLGCWPVNNREDIAWDGFFFIVPDCPGHTGPIAGNWQTKDPQWPEEPDRPGYPSTGGDGMDWLPCDHNHYEGA